MRKLLTANSQILTLTLRLFFIKRYRFCEFRNLTQKICLFNLFIVNLRLTMEDKKEHIKNKQKTDDLARFAKALGHPTRVEILNLLDNQSCCFTGDLVDIFPIAQSTISQHLKELKNAGLIKGEVNPPKIKYCINQKNWEKAKQLFADFFD